MEFSAEQIAGILAGEVLGNPEVKVQALSKIEDGKEGTLSFLSNPKYEEYIYSTKASICIVNKTFNPLKELPQNLTLVKVDDAYACFAKLLDFYNKIRQKSPKIEQPVFIDESAKIEDDLYLGSFAYISKEVEIGKKCKNLSSRFHR